MTPAHKKILELLFYDEESGSFQWKSMTKNGIKAGTIAGTKTPQGYIRIKYKDRIYPAHRLAWLFRYGELPNSEIDHINGVRSDNRISNLRLVTHSQNMFNRTRNINTVSGRKGVTWSKKNQKWLVQCQCNGKRYYLGYFSELCDAVAAATRFREKHHGEYANHGG